MGYAIRKAAVLGAGVMGSTIAAHLANVGIQSYLLDIVPPKLTPEEKEKGLTLESTEVRNRLAREAKERLVKFNPAPLYLPERVQLITPGNLEDNLDWLAEVDWIIEVVVENLAVKRELLQKVAKYRRPGTIVSSNTSGLSINQMVEGMSEEFREHFLGTHFFNPPRYMRLLEIIPGRDTRAEVIEFMLDFGRRVLGKGVVLAKDTPNFIANRIGVFAMAAAVRAMVEDDLSIEEVDALTGPVLGRPKSASFRTLDLVGLDVFMHVAQNIAKSVSDPKEKEMFKLPEFMKTMVDRTWLGAKTGQGFYKKVKTPEKQILVLDYHTMEYRPQSKVKLASLEAAKAVPDLPGRIKTLVFANDRAGQFAWKSVKHVLLYAAEKVREIADDIISVDRAMKWGFNWELGPFELWDALGVAKVVERLEQEGEKVPEVIRQLLDSGKHSFYTVQNGYRYYYDFKTGEYLEEERPVDVIYLPSLKAQNRLVRSNPGASLVDIGDGILCLEFHSRNNAIGADIVEMIRQAVEEVEKNYAGLVIGNHGRNFSVGANLLLLLLEAQDGNWDELELMVREFQQAGMALKYCRKPVVAAPFRMTVGGGCEICLHADRIQAHAETYLGLVEIGVGLLPAGGGTKEMLLRAIENVPYDPKARGPRADLQPMVARAFETIVMAKVSTSAEEAKKLGYLRPADQITLNEDRLIYDAKQTALAMATAGYQPPMPRKFPVLGTDGYAALELMIYTMKEGRFVTEYDAHIARKIAYVISGGDVVPYTMVDEQYILDLEREAFLSLLGEPKTQERIQHMLAKGKPLRN
ncbi:3-hydroxyacyl-CoA dehydrogenase/enoyl-CoA hydratase family protein [Calderihabitans maritimus]|uniref:3-hydroxyacyl-CoA dehydrogenase n=1 Tax=Calderihabitans maritimus TaxID=1246530 RepID=A0A1Z5HV13_9FIRM|nr:3-hydroxyacyl-CoA dehydrogenase/enoyl-CoA hydratase family protein [Calderihabitans maritimus]GAW93344.1 3-hydroxyacyl-CoA dehydrogenase [Calderihabitans maritimus]